MQRLVPKIEQDLWLDPTPRLNALHRLAWAKTEQLLLLEGYSEFDIVLILDLDC